MSLLQAQSILPLSSEPVRIDGEEPLSAAARAMSQRGIGSIVVDVDGRPAGLITDRDVALAALRRPPGSPLQQVKDVASMPLLTLSASAPIEEAAAFFAEHCVRRAGLVNANGELIGVVSSDTVLTFMASVFQTLADGIDRSFRRVQEPNATEGSRLGFE